MQIFVRVRGPPKDEFETAPHETLKRKDICMSKEVIIDGFSAASPYRENPYRYSVNATHTDGPGKWVYSFFSFQTREIGKKDPAESLMSNARIPYQHVTELLTNTEASLVVDWLSRQKFYSDVTLVDSAESQPDSASDAVFPKVIKSLEELAEEIHVFTEDEGWTGGFPLYVFSWWEFLGLTYRFPDRPIESEIKALRLLSQGGTPALPPVTLPAPVEAITAKPRRRSPSRSRRTKVSLP